MSESAWIKGRRWTRGAAPKETTVELHFNGAATVDITLTWVGNGRDQRVYREAVNVPQDELLRAVLGAVTIGDLVSLPAGPETTALVYKQLMSALDDRIAFRKEQQA